MLRILSRKFSDSKKVEEAKKKALEMYEKMRLEQKISLNRKLEEELLSKDKVENKEKHFEVNDYKSDKAKKKIEEIVDKFEFVEDSRKFAQEKTNSTQSTIQGLNLNYYNKIDNDVLLYKLNDFYKNNIDKDKWVKVYEVKFDPNYEKFMNFLMNFLKFVIGYNTFLYLKKFLWDSQDKYTKKEGNLNSATQPTIKDLFYMLLFYSTTLGFYIFNKGFSNRTLSKMVVKGDLVRVFLHNSNKTKQNMNFKEIPIEKLKSITSKSKNLHEILYMDNKNKVGQLFAYKNALYDKNFLINLCNPKVKRVRFTNVNI